MGDRAKKEAFVTLATNDTYALGCLVLGNSLRQTNTARKLVIMITEGVTSSMRYQLERVFDLLHEVDLLDSRDSCNLALLGRPDLSCTFTKLHCWRLTQFDKAVFLDADTLVLQPVDELFDREELSASPDAGWPDCFNSGVFVFKPSEQTYAALRDFALTQGSFDGGDQGLLNLYFRDWATKDIARHLPFIYNVVSQAFYSYLPAFTQFKSDIKIVHFIGQVKPWHHSYNTDSNQVVLLPESGHNQNFLQIWWNIFMKNVQSALDPNVSVEVGGLVGELASLQIISGGPSVVYVDDVDRRLAWERGQMDYMGADSFENIKRKLDSKIVERSPSPVTSRQVESADNSSIVDSNKTIETLAQDIVQNAIDTVVTSGGMSELSSDVTIQSGTSTDATTLLSEETSTNQGDKSAESSVDTFSLSTTDSSTETVITSDADSAVISEIVALPATDENTSVTLSSDTTAESATFALPVADENASVTLSSDTTTESATFALPATDENASFTLPSDTSTESATFALPATDTSTESATFSLPSADDNASVTLSSDTAAESATFALPATDENVSVTLSSDTTAESATFALPATDTNASVTLSSDTITESATFALPASDTSAESATFALHATDTSTESATFALPATDTSADVSFSVDAEVSLPAPTSSLKSSSSTKVSLPAPAEAAEETKPLKPSVGFKTSSVPPKTPPVEETKPKFPFGAKKSVAPLKQAPVEEPKGKAPLTKTFGSKTAPDASKAEEKPAVPKTEEPKPASKFGGGLKSSPLASKFGGTSATTAATTKTPFGPSSLSKSKTSPSAVTTSATTLPSPAETKSAAPSTTKPGDKPEPKASPFGSTGKSWQKPSTDTKSSPFGAKVGASYGAGLKSTASAKPEPSPSSTAAASAAKPSPAAPATTPTRPTGRGSVLNRPVNNSTKTESSSIQTGSVATTTASETVPVSTEQTTPSNTTK